MATVTSLGFNIFSKYNGKGVAAARRDLDALARKSPKVTVQVSTAEATKKINAFKAKVDSLAKKSASIKVKADTGKAATDISAISAKVSALSKKSANIKVKADTSQASKALSALSAKVSKLGNRTVRINVDVDRAMAAINSFATRLRAIKDFTVHVRVDFTQLLALEQVLAVLGRRRIHIPVEVDEEPIERLFSGITRVGNESERTGHRLRGSMSRSNTSVRGLIKSFDAFQGSQMAMLRLALLLGPALVGGLGAGAVAIHQAIVALSAAAGGAAVFALALRNVANIAGSQVAVQITRAKAAVNSFGTGSAHIIGRVMVHAVNAFINILHAVEPAVRPVSKVFLSIAKDIENFTKSPALKAFTGWFKTMAPIAITSLWGTFKVFAEGMYHFLGRIGAFNGQVFLDWLNRSANAFNRWSQGGGPERMKKFFDQWAPVLIQAAKGLLQLAGAMGKALNPAIIILVGWLGKFSGWLAKLINQHPILGQVLAGVILGYKLLGVAISITDHVVDMLNSRLVRNTGAWIANKAQVLASKAAQAGKWLMNSAEFLSIQTANLVRNTAAWIANKAQVLASKAVSIASSIWSAVTALAAQTGALIKNVALWVAQRVALVASRVAMVAIRVATLAWAAAQWLLNAALSANPIGLVIIAVAALVAGIIYAYKHSATFRRIVQGAWNGIKTVVGAVWRFLQPIFHALAEAFKTVWKYAKKYWWVLPAILLGPLGVFITIVAFVATHFKQVVGWFSWVKNHISSLWKATWDGLRGIVSSAWTHIKTTVSTLGGWIAGAFTRMRSTIGAAWNRVWKWIRDVVSFAWSHIKSTVSTMGGWISGAFAKMRTAIGGAWNRVWKWIRDIVSFAWSHIRSTVSTIGGWLTSAFNKIRGSVGGAWNRLWTWMRQIFNFAWGKLHGSILAMGNWLGKQFSNIRKWVGNTWNALWTHLRNVFNFAWNKLHGSILAMGNWLGKQFGNIRRWLGNTWNALWTHIRNVFNFAWGKLHGSILVMGNWLGKQFSNIRRWVGNLWNALWTHLRNVFNFAWSKLHGSLLVMGNWMGKQFSNIRRWIGNLWNAMWTHLRNVFNFAWGKLHDSMLVMGNWMGKQFGNIKNWIVRLWDGAWHKIRDIFNWSWGKIRGSMNVMAKTMSNIWHGIVNAAGSIFNGIKRAVGRPINTVIGFVQTLAKLADKALGLVGVKSGLFNAIKGWKVTGYNKGGIVGQDKPTMGFAMGGLMPGYSPGRDNLVAPSPIGPVGLSGGEGILRPEVMRAPGMKEFLYKANRKARSGGIAGVRHMISGPSSGEDTFKKFGVAPAFQNPNGGFAKGGVVANFDDGGVFGKIFGGIKKAVSVASHFVPGIGSLDTIFKGGKKIFEKTGFDMIVDKVLGKAMDKAIGATSKLGAFGRITAGFGRKVIDGIVQYVVGKTTPVSADGDPFYKNPSKRLKHALSWAKSQAGKPYQWGGGGNPSYDCSGFMASIQRVINGQGPGRLYTTHNFHGKTAPSGWKQDAASPFMVGVTNAGVGHMAGTLINNHVESAGSRGVNVGPKARGAFDKLFKWHYGYMPVAKEATLVGGGNGRGGPMAGTIGKSGEAWVGTFWDTGHSGYGDTGAPASGKKMHKFALASRNLIPYGKTAIMQAFGKKRMAAFESIDYGPGITSRLFDIDTYGAAWLFGREKQWSASNPGRDVSPGVFRVHWKKGYGQGGNIPGGQLSLVGERGPEVMVPNKGQTVFKSGTDVSVGDTHVHFHDKVYVKSEKEFQKMVVTAISEAKRKKKI